MDEDREELLDQEASPKSAPAYTSRGQQRRRQRSVFQYITILFAAGITTVVVMKIHIQRKTEAEVYLLRERRKKRLNDIGLTTAEFDLVIQERKRSSYQAERNRRHSARKSPR